MEDSRINQLPSVVNPSRFLSELFRNFFRRGVAFLSAEGGPDLREGGKRGGFTSDDKIGRACEIVPDERLYIRLDNDIRLLAPSEIRVALDDGE